VLISAIELLLTAATAAAFWAAAGRSPAWVFGAALRRFGVEPAYRTSILLAIAILAADIVEAQLDDKLTAALGYDATPWIHWIEGDLGALFQRASWLPLTFVFTFFYVVACPVILAAPLFLSAAEARLIDFRALIRGLAANYLVCLPFYFFFPVKEMWAGNPTRVRLLVDDLSPAIMEAYRSTSALDNCFPSFHTSLTVTAAILTARSGPRALSVLVWISAAGVVLSTLYLGIHWMTDVVAGLILGVAAAWWAGIDRRSGARPQSRSRAGPR